MRKMRTKAITYKSNRERIQDNLLWFKRLTTDNYQALAVVKSGEHYKLTFLDSRVYSYDYYCSLSDNDFAKLLLSFTSKQLYIYEDGYMSISYSLAIINECMFNEDLAKYDKCFAILVNIKINSSVYASIYKRCSLLVSRSMCFNVYSVSASSIILYVSIPWEFGLELINFGVDSFMDFHYKFKDLLSF